MAADSWDGWAVTNSVEKDTGVYYFLNIRVGAQRQPVTVKSRTEGTYLCLLPECRDAMRTPIGVGDPDDSRRGCTHSRFVRAYERARESAPEQAPEQAPDFPADALEAAP